MSRQDAFYRTPADDEEDEIIIRENRICQIVKSFQGSLCSQRDKSGENKIKCVFMNLPIRLARQINKNLGEVWLCVHESNLGKNLYLTEKQERPHAKLVRVHRTGKDDCQFRLLIPVCFRGELGLDCKDIVTFERIKKGVYKMEFSKKTERVKPEVEHIDGSLLPPESVKQKIPKGCRFDSNSDTWFFMTDEGLMVNIPDPYTVAERHPYSADDEYGLEVLFQQEIEVAVSLALSRKYAPENSFIKSAVPVTPEPESETPFCTKEDR